MTTTAYPLPHIGANAGVSTGAALPPAGAQTPDGARQAASEFEAVFLSVMLNQMFAGVKTEAPSAAARARKCSARC